MSKVSGSQSTKIGFPPSISTTFAVARKVIAGTITSSPRLIFKANNAAIAPLVQLLVSKAYLQLKKFDNFFSTFSPNFPVVIILLLRIFFISLRLEFFKLCLKKSILATSFCL